MSQRTAFLSKLVGIYCLFIALSMFVHKQATVDEVLDLIHSPASLLLISVLTSSVGLALVLGHNVWSGSALAITLTVIGWLTLAKGLLFLLVPSEAAITAAALHYEQLLYLYAAITLVIGAYLTYGGFTLTRHD